ncbi:MAG: hypothetical protein MUP45_03440 [Candidatus Marinimicrobia bacterium]|nr:hypothetical protein [Candidatus Neomarinimicrobiota bacterium]
MNLPKTLDPTKIPIRASTQEHLDIEDIQDGLVILKDGSCCLVIATTAINFGLLSEKEQEATIYAYAGLLNSLTFAIQIVLRSQSKDISGYLELVKRAEEKEGKKEIREQIQKYRQFIQETVAKNEVLDKKFYLIIPMSALELGAKQVLTTAFARKKLPFEKEEILRKAKTNLYPKRDHVFRQLSRLGLKGRQLNTQELIQLFFNIYNPEVKGQQLTTSEQYQQPLVEPAMEKVANLPVEAPAIPTAKPVSSEPEMEIKTQSNQGESVQNQIDGLIKQAVEKRQEQ